MDVKITIMASKLLPMGSINSPSYEKKLQRFLGSLRGGPGLFDVSVEGEELMTESGKWYWYCKGVEGKEGDCGMVCRGGLDTEDDAQKMADRHSEKYEGHVTYVFEGDEE